MIVMGVRVDGIGIGVIRGTGWARGRMGGLMVPVSFVIIYYKCNKVK